MLDPLGVVLSVTICLALLAFIRVSRRWGIRW